MLQTLTGTLGDSDTANDTMYWENELKMDLFSTFYYSAYGVASAFIDI